MVATLVAYGNANQQLVGYTQIEATSMLEASKKYYYYQLYGGDLSKVNPDDTTAIILVYLVEPDGSLVKGGDVTLGFRDPEHRSYETIDYLGCGGYMCLPGY